MSLTDRFAGCVADSITDEIVNTELDTLDEIGIKIKNILNPDVDYNAEIDETIIGKLKNIEAREAFLLLALYETMQLYNVDDSTARKMLAMQMRLRKPYQRLWRSKVITRESYVQIRRDIEVYICSRFGVLPTNTEYYKKRFKVVVQDRPFPSEEDFSLHPTPTL